VCHTRQPFSLPHHHTHAAAPPFPLPLALEGNGHHATDRHPRHHKQPVTTRGPYAMIVTPVNPFRSQTVIPIDHDSLVFVQVDRSVSSFQQEIISRPIIPISISMFARNQTGTLADFQGEISFERILPSGSINSMAIVCSNPLLSPPIPFAVIGFTRLSELSCPKNLANFSGIQVCDAPVSSNMQNGTRRPDPS